jgi:hypothetical protein
VTNTVLNYSSTAPDDFPPIDRHDPVLEAAVAFDDPGLTEILHHVRVTNR